MSLSLSLSPTLTLTNTDAVSASTGTSSNGLAVPAGPTRPTSPGEGRVTGDEEGLLLLLLQKKLRTLFERRRAALDSGYSADSPILVRIDSSAMKVQDALAELEDEKLDL